MRQILNRLTRRFRRPGFHELKLPALGGRIGGTWRKGRWYEAEMLDYIRGLRLSGVYLDVGANIGNHTLYFATQTAAERVIAFEPTAEALPTLRKLVADNGVDDRVTIVPCAASDAPGEFDIAIGNTMNAAPQRVKAVAIDEIAPRGVTVVKMDIEGAEPAALRGMKRVLEQDRPVLFIEAHTEAEKAEIEGIISPFGYKATGRVFNASPTYEFTAS